MENEALKRWKEMFYSEEWNPALRAFKRACRWAMLNVPDASGTLGLKRCLVNLAAVLGFSAGFAIAFAESRSLLELLLLLYLASWIPTLFFFKIFAASILYGIEKYQAAARRVLLGSEQNKAAQQAAETLFKAA